MPNNPVKEYQRQLAPKLGALFGVPCEIEWPAMRPEGGMYSPRLDIAVGPFAVGDSYCVPTFDRLVRQHERFLKYLYQFHLANLAEDTGLNRALHFERVVSKNSNARCFLAIEIENRVSRKHLMGGAINAAALGRIGIAVGWTTQIVRALVRLRSYLLFLAGVGKNTFDPANLLILGKDQLEGALDSRSQSD